MQIAENIMQAIWQARHLVVFTGAGVSAESGVHTFRDALTGLWAKFEPMQLATPEAFLRDPALVWHWYEWRRQRLLKVQPNPAHNAIAQFEKKVPKFTLITQNVDNLHERAGNSVVLHLHGSIFTPRCFDCAQPYVFTGAPQIGEAQIIAPPVCGHCGGIIRPGVVWFGEALPEYEVQAAFAAAEACDCLLSIGTSGVVQPAAMIPDVALQSGATVIHINPEPVPVTGCCEFSLQGTAGKLLPLLLSVRDDAS